MTRKILSPAALRVFFAVAALAFSLDARSADRKSAKLGGLPAVTLTPIATTGLTSPVQVTTAHDGSGRLFIVDHTGIVHIYKDGALLPTPFLDISSLVEYDSDERGMNSIVFHPDYPCERHTSISITSTSRSPGTSPSRATGLGG